MSKRDQYSLRQERIITEKSTGEILDRERTFRVPKEPDFVKLYLDCIATFKGLSKGISPFLMEILKYMTYADDYTKGGQTVTLTGFQRKQIAQRLGITDSAVMKNIKQLVNANILSRVALSVYQVNPEIFGKGDWTDISRLRQLRATFDFKTGTIQADMELEEEDKQIELQEVVAAAKAEQRQESEEEKPAPKKRATKKTAPPKADPQDNEPPKDEKKKTKKRTPKKKEETRNEEKIA